MLCSTYGEVFIRQFGKQNCNKFRLIVFPEPAGPHPDRVIDRYFILELLKMQGVVLCYFILVLIFT